MKIIAIFILSLALRLLYLGSVPVSLSHDETDNIIQAHSVIQTGTDIEASWKPWSLLPNDGVMAELGPLINAPVLSLLHQSIFSSRLTTAILSSVFPLLIWWWLTLLKVNHRIALSASFLLAISPWHLIFSRTALEQPTSLFFYLLSWIFLTKVFEDKKSFKYFIKSFVIFAITYSIGYFSYHGYKFSFPVLTSIYLGWLFFNTSSGRTRKLAFSLILVAGLVVRTLFYSHYYGSRSGEIIFTNQAKFVSQVNDDRRLSVAPDYLKSIFANKPIAIISTIRDKYLSAISPDLLFVRGETNGVFSVWQRGYFYLFTLPLIILGLVSLFRFQKSSSFLIISLLIFSPLATIIHVNNSLAFRSAIYFVVLNIVLAYGLVYFFELIERFVPKLYLLCQVAIAGLFVLGLAGFLYSFYYVGPIVNATDYFFHDRLLSNYVRLSSGSKLLIVTPQPRYIYSGIILSLGTPSLEVMNTFNHSYSPSDSSNYHTDNLDVVQSCSKIDLEGYQTIVVDKNLLETSLRECRGLEREDSPHLDLQKPRSIVAPKDSGERYRIYGDSLCQDVLLDKYIHPLRLVDFSLEKMTKDQFCSKWIVSQ